MRDKKRIKPFLKRIEEYWKKNPDLRFTQVLIHLNIIPNFPGFLYYKEDSEQELKKPQDWLPKWGENIEWA